MDSGILRDGSRYDLVIVGSGAASITSALAARRMGRSVIILEKEDVIGGSTSLSGGVLWVPDNPLMAQAGIPDSYAEARTYLDACAGAPAPGSTRAQREAYLRAAPAVIAMLLDLGMKLIAPPHYSDYHEGELPGAKAGGRSLIAPNFDLRRLGKHADRLRQRTPPMPVSLPDIAELGLAGQTWKSRFTFLKVGLQILQNRLLRRRIVGLGTAIQGRLFRIAIDHDIPIVTEAAAIGLIGDDGRVQGVELQHDGQRKRIFAGHGVLLNTGGFARNQPMRDRHQSAPTSQSWTHANPGDTGEMIEAAMALGAATHRMHLCIWTPTSLLPGDIPVITMNDMAKPHAIMVDQSGQRYVNEATSYVRIGMAMYERNKQVPAIPSWIVFDQQHRDKYWFARQATGRFPEEWVRSGFVTVAASLDELARMTGISPAGLGEGVARFNAFCVTGQDGDFRRGVGKYDQMFGDPRRPNPNLGPIEKPPYYAVKVYPGDVGTFGGLVTDEHARVLSKDDRPIAGLYATGNATAPVVGPSYPGAGASIAASMVFGVIAARHAMGENDDMTATDGVRGG